MGVAAVIAVTCVYIGNSLFYLVTWPLGLDKNQMTYGYAWRRSLAFVAMDLNPLWSIKWEEGDIPSTPPPGRVIFVANHSSLSDVVAIGRHQKTII